MYADRCTGPGTGKIRSRDIIRDPIGAIKARLDDAEGEMLDSARRLGAPIQVVQYNLGWDENEYSSIHLIGIGLRFEGEDYLLWKFEAHSARAILFALSVALGGADVIRGEV